MEVNENKYHFVVYTRELNSFEDKILFEKDIYAIDEETARIKAEKERKIWLDTTAVKPLRIPLLEKIYEKK
jgi:hypothetical protein